MGIFIEGEDAKRLLLRSMHFIYICINYQEKKKMM